MPKFLKDKLKAQYGADSPVPYKVMNAIGAMKGNKETPKGAAMQAKHDRDAKPKATRISPAAADRINEKVDRLTRR
jgi:hypothetical protein